MQAFPLQDRAKDLKDLVGMELLPLQRSLGLTWNLETDSFTFCVSQGETIDKKRCSLSSEQSVWSPGILSPSHARRKELHERAHRWTVWMGCTTHSCKIGTVDTMEKLHERTGTAPNSLQDITSLTTQIVHKELCIFSDAWNTAISAIAYLKTVSETGDHYVGFVMGKSKLALRPAHTIPRLELCAAVLAVEMADLISDELDIDIDSVTFYCKIVLGYIYNTSRHFYVYVSNRPNRISGSMSALGTIQLIPGHGQWPLQLFKTLTGFRALHCCWDRSKFKTHRQMTLCSQKQTEKFGLKSQL